MMAYECNHPFGLFLSGAEAPAWHKVLRETEGEHIALGFLALRPRLPKNRQYLLSERFEDRFEILIDSGGFGADRREGFDHQDHAIRYTEWVEQNIDRISLVTEYDVVSLGLEWVKFWRDRFWNHVPVEKFVPVWHEEYGADELEALCDNYERVGVVKPANTNIEAKLRNLVARSGVKLHGVGITGPDTLARVPFATVSSTSWISPSKNGEFHCWAGNKLNWYPRSSADSQRKLHRANVERAGFNADLVEVGDNSEVNHYSAWVWRQYEKQLAERADIRQGTADIVDITDRLPPKPDSEVAHKVPKQSTNLPAVRRERVTIPGLAFHTVEVANPQGEGTKTVNVPGLNPDILRVCDNCSLQNVCPENRPGSACAYRVPVELRTMEQLQGWASTLLEIQMQRVIMLRMSEEVSGGAPDTALSQELDRMSRLQLQFKELFEDGFSLTIHAKGSGRSGVGLISQLFGAEAGGINYAANQAIDPGAAEQVVATFIEVEGEDV
jgi:hypothetical protein